MTTCYKCGREIYFSNEVMTESGKYIPVDCRTHEPHICDDDEKQEYNEQYGDPEY